MNIVVENSSNSVVGMLLQDLNGGKKKKNLKKKTTKKDLLIVDCNCLKLLLSSCHWFGRDNSHAGGQECHSDKSWQVVGTGQQACHAIPEQKIESSECREDSQKKMKHLHKKDLWLWQTKGCESAGHSFCDDGQQCTWLQCRKNFQQDTEVTIPLY